jgi:hypothetical protein
MQHASSGGPRGAFRPWAAREHPFKVLWEITMERRELLSLMGIGAAGLLGSGVAKASSQQDEKEKQHEHMKVMGECIHACNDLASHSLKYLASDKPENREHVAKVHELTMDCQDICVLTATMMLRQSPLAKTMHQACATACGTCATECEKSEHEATKKCAEACRACEKFCKECCAA